MKFVLYADDTSLVEPIGTFNADYNNCPNVSESINYELNLITDWLSLNKLSLNAKKTKMMIFHHRQRNISKIKLGFYQFSKCLHSPKKIRKIENIIGRLRFSLSSFQNRVQDIFRFQKISML